MRLYLDEHRGIYIPQVFARITKHECVDGVRGEVWAALEAGPDHDLYWDAWQEVLDNATLTDPKTNVRYTVYQNGTCWLIPEGMEWDDEQETYIWPEQPEN